MNVRLLRGNEGERGFNDKTKILSLLNRVDDVVNG